MADINRTRNRDRLDKEVNTVVVHTTNGIPSVANISTPGSVFIDRLSDVVGNPGHVNPCSKLTQTFTPSSGWSVQSLNQESYSVTGNVPWWAVSSLGAGTWNAPVFLTNNVGPSVDDLTYDAKLRALSKMDKTTFNFGEDVAEVRKTLELLRGFSKPLVDINKDFYKDIKRNRPLGNVRYVSDMWLTYRFAYGNVYRTLLNGIDAYAQRNSAKPVRKRATAKFDAKSKEIAKAFTFTSSGGTVHSFLYEETEQISVAAGFHYENLNPLNGWADHLGTRLKDLPLIGWQVAPASWFVDKFINISDGIKAVSNIFDNTLVLGEGWCTVTRVSKKTDTYFGKSGSPWSVSGVWSPSVTDTKTIDRTIWVPTILDASPRFHFDLDWTSDLDATAYVLSKFTHAFR